MTGLLLALIATLIVGLGARDQVLTAQFADRRGGGAMVLPVAIISGAVAAALAAWAGSQVAGLMIGNARLFLVGLALGLAGLEMALLKPRTAPAEPTRSLGAFAIVIFAAQLTDAARFVVFALAALTRAPLTTGLGAAIGAALVVALGVIAAELVRAPWLAVLRRWLGAGLALLGMGLAAQAMGYL